MESLIGKIVKITQSLFGHGFKIGDHGIIQNYIKLGPRDRLNYLVSVKDQTYWMSKLEFEVIEQSAVKEIQITTTISRRDYFAAAALQGIIAAHNIYETGIDNEVNARCAVNAAEALIKQLDKE